MLIPFCMKDPGGTQCVVQVAKDLMPRGVDTSLYAEPGSVGAKILKFEEKLPFTEDFDSILAQKPDMIVSSIDTKNPQTSLSMTIEVTRKAQAAGIPVAWIQDLWGNHIKPYWDDSVRPNYIFTLDDAGAKKIAQTWPDFDQSKVFPFGQPKFDLVAGMQLDSTLRAFKESLNARGVSIITVAGQISGMLDCIQNFFSALHGVLGQASQRVFIDFMHHGRCPVEMVDEFRKEYPNLKVGLATELTGLDRNQRQIQANVLFTMFSTDAVTASVLGKHVISCLLPEGRESFEKEGYTGEFALTEAGACLGVSTYDELVEALSKVLLEPNKCHHRKIETDGQSAKRIADKLIELVS